MIRLLGGTMFLTGVVIMFVNVLMTIKGHKVVNPTVPAPQEREIQPAPAAAV